MHATLHTIRRRKRRAYGAADYALEPPARVYLPPLSLWLYPRGHPAMPHPPYLLTMHARMLIEPC